MDNLTSLLKAVGSAAVNHDVRSKILECIQSWAAATEGRYELNYIGEVYKTLQREGFQFPPRPTVSSSMIDSSAVCARTILISFKQAANNLAHSLPNGSTRMFVCGAGLPSPLPIANIIAATVETFLTSSARPKQYRCLTWEYYSLSGLMMDAMRS